MCSLHSFFLHSTRNKLQYFFRFTSKSIFWIHFELLHGLDSVLIYLQKVRHNNYNKLTMLIWTVVTEIAHLKSFHGRKKSFQPFNCETDKWLFCTKSLGNKFLLISEDRKVFVWKNDEIKRMPVTNKLLCTTINNHFHQTC